MELIEIPSQKYAGGGRLLLPHAWTGLPRRLDLDEQVLVLADGEYRGASVEGVEVTAEGRAYVLRVGDPVPADLAAEHLAGMRTLDALVEDLARMLDAAV